MQMDSLATWQVIKSADDVVVYKGFTSRGKPYGSGTAYFPNGNKYQEGVFDVKGLLYGREYYPSGRVRFEGAYRLCMAYGPNYPVYGKCYDPDGHMYYEGVLKVRFGGVGYPSVEIPEQFGPIAQAEKPEIDWFMWSDPEK